ncbi:CGNR zinc finger domain-containing protein [Actinoplanes sp. NPDC051859]|uniref:CGNR zinc finger domain-containing protein n=1 Tax=Actinoplanes sp. NPDC051859 TaxID=3363909 RepID=UPI0037B572F8
MHINPYGEDPVRLAVDLVTNPPTTEDDLADRCRAAGVSLDQPVAEGDLADTRAFLADWLAVVDAADDDTRARLLNDLLMHASAYPRLTNHAGSGWHLHYRNPHLTVSAQLRVLISVGTAMHLAGRGMHRLGRCSADGCNHPYADTSRTGRQRYCSPACANRDAVRRHRARLAA